MGQSQVVTTEYGQGIFPQSDDIGAVFLQAASPFNDPADVKMGGWVKFNKNW